MTSRVRSIYLKRSAFDVAHLVTGVAERLELASGKVELELERRAEWIREMEVLARRQLSATGTPLPEISKPSSAEHTGAAHPHETLCVAPRRAIADIRLVEQGLREALSAGTQSAGARVPVPMRLREKAPRKGSKLNIERTIASLLGWAAEAGLAEPGSPIEMVASAHLHLPGTESAATCTASPCRKLAVCRVLEELIETRVSPLREAIRDLAQAAFDAAGELEGITRLLGADGVPVAVAAKVREVVASLRSLDRSVRERGLLAADDHVERGKRAPDHLLLVVTEYLYVGGFEPEEIAELVDDGGRAKGRARLKNVRRRLERYKSKRFLPGHMNAPDA